MRGAMEHLRDNGVVTFVLLQYTSVVMPFNGIGRRGLDGCLHTWRYSVFGCTRSQ